MSIRIARPNGALRFALRLPVHLYHMGLGALLDHRFMLLTHRGRKSGCLHETVLEVVMYDKPNHTSYVLSGWRDKSDWYRNIKAQPAVRVQVGGENYSPVQHFLTPEETRRVWAEFRRKHRLEERMALWLYSVQGEKYKNVHQRREELLSSALMVSFRSRKDARKPKQRTKGPAK